MAFWIIVFIIIGIVAYIVDDGNFFSKLALAMTVSWVALWILKWITGMEIMATLAKISGSVLVISILINILLGIFVGRK